MNHLDCGQEEAGYGLNATEEAGGGAETDRLKPELRFGGRLGKAVQISIRTESLQSC